MNIQLTFVVELELDHNLQRHHYVDQRQHIFKPKKENTILLSAICLCRSLLL